MLLLPVKFVKINKFCGQKKYSKEVLTNVITNVKMKTVKTYIGENYKALFIVKVNNGVFAK